MAKKKDVTLPMPDDIGGDFEDEDSILNYRPNIEYIEPEQQYYQDPSATITSKEAETIDNLRDRTQKLIDGFKAVSQLADIAQKRIDKRVEESGGLSIKLDPANPQDYQTIAAMKRRFPDKKDHTIITYNDYKQTLNCIKENAVAAPQMTADDIKIAKSNPYKTNFGGFENQQGENRAELSSNGNAIKPLDLAQFQKTAVLALFALMLPLIKKEDQLEIVKHKIDTPHK